MKELSAQGGVDTFPTSAGCELISDDTAKRDGAAPSRADAFALLVSHAQIIGLWQWDVRADRVVADARFAELYGVDPARAAKGAPIAEFIQGVHPDDRVMLTQLITRVFETGEPFACEYRLRQPGERVRHVLARGQVTFGDDGKAAHFGGATIDITDQRIAELALRESQERYQSLFDSIDAGFCIIEMKFDDDGGPIDYRLLEINPAFERQTGLSNAQGKWVRDIVPGHEQHWFDLYGRVAQTGEAARFENEAAGLGRWYDVHAFRTGAPEENRVAVLFNDISETKVAEAALRASEAQFRTLAEAMPNHVWTSPATGLLDWFNDRVYAYSGAKAGALDGQGWTSMVHPDDLDGAAARWGQALATGSTYETEFRLRRADGEYRWHIARAVPLRDEDGEITRWVGTNTDIEDQKAATASLAEINATLEARVEERTHELMAAQESLRQAQKMEAIGQLTGGIAHDFNNLLTGIIGSLAMMRRRIAAGRTDELGRFMDAATASAQRAASLTHRLLAFARRQSLDTQACDVNALVVGLHDLLRQTLGENVSLALNSDPAPWMALTDAHQLENALLNLAINARDAMPEGGVLTVSTGNERVTDDEEIKPGDYVVVSVTDTGVGMPEDVAKRAFDPFFTTKPIGQGTGLGLSMIHGFLNQSGGQVRLFSEVGKGTTVKLYLPRASTIAARASDAAPDAPAGRGETILVVEDDDAVRLLVTTLLDELGYRYHEAADPRMALPRILSDDPIDLLVTDVGLPHMNGRQLAEAARQKRPDLKVLFITGYAEQAADRGDFLDQGMEMITKPFELDALAEAIRKLIDSNS